MEGKYWVANEPHNLALIIDNRLFFSQTDSIVRGYPASINASLPNFLPRPPVRGSYANVADERRRFQSCTSTLVVNVYTLLHFSL